MINSFREEYAFLSNFFEAPVVYNGLHYQNNEAAFQSAKTLDLEKRIKFAKMNPSQAKAEGRRLWLRSDWENVKLQVMYEICYSKFTLNPDLGEKLLATGNEYLEEGNTWGDTFWGTVDGHGQNWLGKILMRVREELRQGARFFPVEITETRVKTVYVTAETPEKAAEVAHRLYVLDAISMENGAAISSACNQPKNSATSDMLRYQMTGEKYGADGDQVFLRAD